MEIEESTYNNLLYIINLQNMKFLVIFGCAMIFLFITASTVNAGSGQSEMPSLAGYVSQDAHAAYYMYQDYIYIILTTLIYSVG